jgi:hypothetical protein
MSVLKVALGILALFCAGCAVLEPEAASLARSDDALRDALFAARAPESQQRAALTRARQAFAADPSPVNRLRVATLLALLPPPLRDQPRAAELLVPIADARKPGVGRSAALLAAALAEQRRLGAEVERLSKEGERAAREWERLDREHEKREEALREQVEALRSIERNIQEREEKLRRGQR